MNGSSTGTALLYSLALDCPFPWPANPSYLSTRPRIDASTSTSAGAAAASAKAGVNGDNSAMSVRGRVQLEQDQDREDEAMTSVAAAAELAQDNDGQAVLHEKIDQKNGTMPSWPSTLRELYLECLYAPAPATTKDADTRSSSKATGESPAGAFLRLIEALQAGIYSPVAPSTSNVTMAKEGAVEGLAYTAILPLLMDLQSIDAKWHTAVPRILQCWQAQAEGQQMDSVNVDEVGLAGDESCALKAATARMSSHVGTAFGTADWLSQLEVTEIELQIVLLLHLLSLPPGPAPSTTSAKHRKDRLQRSSRNANSGRNPAADWLSAVDAAAAPQLHSGQTPRKRKFSTAVAATPRAYAILPNEAAAEEEAALYKRSAIRLDELTDSLAIQQAVRGIGDSLSDLWADAPTKAQGEEDPIRIFWIQVEASFRDKVTEDMLDGCRSKFFSYSSLDASLLHHQHEHNEHRSVQATPDLQQLAASVHAAQEAARRARIPASPTLAKLLAADRAREQAEERQRLAGIDEEDEEEEQEDASWLLPPVQASRSTAPLARSASMMHATTLAPDQQVRQLQRSKSTNSHPSRNLFKTVQTSFGTRQSASAPGVSKPAKKAGGFVRSVSQHEEERVSKRKLASPKRNVSASASVTREGGERERGRTLVLATPARERVVKVKKKQTHMQGMGLSPFVKPQQTHAQPIVGTAEDEEECDEMDLLRDARNGGGAVLVGETPAKP